MKKIHLFISLIFITLLSVNAFCLTFNNRQIIDIILTGEPVEESKDGLHRNIYYAMIKDNVLTFDSFEADCSLQIIDVDNETVVFEDFVFSGDTQCAIPIIPTGNYMIKFESYEFVYSGYFQI